MYGICVCACFQLVGFGYLLCKYIQQQQQKLKFCKFHILEIPFELGFLDNSQATASALSMHSSMFLKSLSSANKKHLSCSHCIQGTTLGQGTLTTKKDDSTVLWLLQSKEESGPNQSSRGRLVFWESLHFTKDSAHGQYLL